LKNNYNRIAPYYKLLVKLVFGRSHEQAQRCFLNLVEGPRILVVGGGAGSFLPHLLKLKPELEIDFLEPSRQMVKLAKKELTTDQRRRVNFIEKPIEKAAFPVENYQAILVYFFFDLFPKSKSKVFFKQLSRLLKKEGIWLIADFYPPKRWHHKIVVKLMFIFLRYTTCAETAHIYRYEDLFQDSSLQKKGTYNFYQGLIFSSWYKKTA
jgi:ubiquinone/menaquinone biosynthesis C-methylase UbiE